MRVAVNETFLLQSNRVHWIGQKGIDVSAKEGNGEKDADE